jgi:hypothetical protein
MTTTVDHTEKTWLIPPCIGINRNGSTTATSTYPEPGHAS